MTLAVQRPARAATPRIDVRGLRKSFSWQQGPVPVLDGLSLSVADGEFVSILGPTGCGKSTLFSLLMGIEPVDDGSILIDRAPAAQTANPFAWMPQRDVLALISPRLVLFVLWIFSDVLSRAFDSWIVPLLGFILLPWTTLAYAAFWEWGSGHHVTGFEWFFVILAFLIDLGSYGQGRRVQYARASG